MNGSVVVRTMQTDGGRLVPLLWDRLGGIRGAMVAVLPVVLEVVSPQRPAQSVIIAIGYLALALAVARPTRADVPFLTYAVVAFAFIGLSMLRAQFIDPLSDAQRSYGLGKGGYFITAIVPLSVAVALIIRKAEDIKPAVAVYIVIGVLLALVSLPLHSNALLGASRYTVQGNLEATAALMLLQYGILRDIRIVLPLVALCLVGVAITESRQSVAALLVGVPATAVYWFAAERWGAGGTRRVFAKIWRPPAILFGAGVGVALTWTILALQSWIDVPQVVRDPISCSCIAGRFITVVTQPGGRNEMVGAAWSLFASHPLFGAGLGAFVGLLPPAYPYPHNIELELGSELGLVGIFVLLVPLAAGWVRLAGTGIKEGSAAVASVLALVLVYTVSAHVSGDLASQRGLFVYGMVAVKLAWRAT